MRFFHRHEQEPLKAGDLVKIELGCHVDYYSAVVAHTVKVRLLMFESERETDAAGCGLPSGVQLP